jgi:hypothetical protein
MIAAKGKNFLRNQRPDPAAATAPRLMRQRTPAHQQADRFFLLKKTN